MFCVREVMRKNLLSWLFTFGGIQRAAVGEIINEEGWWFLSIIFLTLL